MGNSALSLPKHGELCSNLIRENRHWRQWVIIDKPFLTLDWKSRAERCIFYLNYLLPNANFKRKMVINRYVRCLFGPKRVKVKTLRLSCSRCLICQPARSSPYPIYTWKSYIGRSHGHPNPYNARPMPHNSFWMEQLFQQAHTQRSPHWRSTRS